MRRLLIALSLTLFVGCGSDAGTSPASQEFGGDYVLQTINGRPLPYTFTFTGGASYTISSDRYTILPGGSWISSRTYTAVSGGSSSTVTGGETGTWTRTPSTGVVSLVSRDQTTFLTGTAAGSTMTVTASTPDVYVYAR